VTAQNINRKVIEHIPELQMIPDFLQHSNARELPSRRTPGPEYTGLSDAFIVNGLNESILTNPPPMRGGGQSNQPIARMMNAFGSTNNDDGFVLIDGRLNYVKTRV
jgi:chitinase